MSGFLTSSRKIFDYVNDNPANLQLEMDYVNNPNTIARDPKVVADSIGHKDFIRGAALSEDGKSIIAISSLTRNRLSKIIFNLQRGAGVAKWDSKTD